jgi:chromosome segregation ATPase
LQVVVSNNVFVCFSALQQQFLAESTGLLAEKQKNHEQHMVIENQELKIKGLQEMVSKLTSQLEEEARESAARKAEIEELHAAKTLMAEKYCKERQDRENLDAKVEKMQMELNTYRATEKDMKKIQGELEGRVGELTSKCEKSDQNLLRVVGELDDAEQMVVSLNVKIVGFQSQVETLCTDIAEKVSL